MLSTGEVHEENVQRVTQICSLLSAMLKLDVNMVVQAVPQLNTITHLIYQLLHRLVNFSAFHLFLQVHNILFL